MDRTTPIILVFYIDRATLERREIVTPFMESLNDVIDKKKFNIFPIFAPTDGVERIECLNPVLYHEADLTKVDEIVNLLKNQFDIGNGGDLGKSDVVDERD